MKDAIGDQHTEALRHMHATRAHVQLTSPEHIGHLSEHRRRELGAVARILFEEFENAQKDKQLKKGTAGSIVKLVLFGSCANCLGVEAYEGDDRAAYNLLVVVSTKTFADPGFWDRARDRLRWELTVTRCLKTPVNFIVYSIMDLNNQLVLGRPFFVDIVRDGIMIHDRPGFPFVKPKPLDLEVARAEMLQHFDHWFPNAEYRFELAKHAVGRGYNREAAFDLHQTAEQLYHGTLRVLTLHSPKSHRLAWLRTHAERVTPRLIAVWPRDSFFAAQRFARLDKAYIGARYSRHYKIDEEDLAWLIKRVTLLQRTAVSVCTARLESAERASLLPKPQTRSL